MRFSASSLARSRFLAAFVVLLLASSLSAQYSEQVDVSIATIDVVVRDKAGNLVRGLTKEDFDIYEDGELQKITNFSAIDVSDAPRVRTSGETSSAQPVRAPRLLVVFLDIQDIDPAPRKEFFRSVQTFLSSALHEGDYATILAWNHRIRIILPPTAQRELLDSTIGEFSKQGFSPLMETLERLQEDRLGEAAADAAFARSIGIEPKNDLVTDKAFADFVKFEKQCAKIRRKSKEVRNLLTHLSKIDMKKVLLFASDDMTLRVNKRCDNSFEFSALANTANAYGITIHGIHPPGPRERLIGPDQTQFLPDAVSPTTMASEYERVFDEMSGLTYLARLTGGVTGSGRQSAQLLKRAAEELDVYYSIGYALAPGKEDRARKVKVVPKNGKYRVRTRDAVVRLSEEARLRDQITANLYFPESNDRQSPAFTARLVRAVRDGSLLRIGVELSIRAGDLFVPPTATGETKKGSFSVFVAAGHDLGDASDVTELRQEFEPRTDTTPETPYIYTFETRIRPDSSRLSLAVRDNNSGSVAMSVVPLRKESE
jgi:VWFA-related protein